MTTVDGPLIPNRTGGERDQAGSPDARPRARFRYSKLGKIRFTSHRDVARMWERALRRSGLPISWSGGFSPRPQLSFGLALPTGAESLGEYLEVRFDAGRPVDLAGAAALLGGLLPEGITLQAAAMLFDGAGSVQQDVASCCWEMEVLGVTDVELEARVERLLDSTSVLIQRERKGRVVHDDLRPAVLTLSLLPGDRSPDNGSCHIRAELSTHPRGVRPQELLQALGTGAVLVRACRTKQWIERDGARWEPLSIDGSQPGAIAVHATERAS